MFFEFLIIIMFAPSATDRALYFLTDKTLTPMRNALKYSILPPPTFGEDNIAHTPYRANLTGPAVLGVCRGGRACCVSINP